MAVSGLALVVGVGLVVQETAKLVSTTVKVDTHTSQAQVVHNANFNYLVPGPDADWSFDQKTVAQDQTKGLVEYKVQWVNLATTVTVSQQQLPAQLKPRDGNKFAGFIGDQKPAKSEDVGLGKAYYLPFMVNDELSDTSTNRVIYATDDILMFGQSNRQLSYDLWSRLLLSMQSHK
jgi:hypothetical protein